MAELEQIKISQLTELPYADLVAGDMFPVVDASTMQTMRIDVAAWVESFIKGWMLAEVVPGILYQMYAGGSTKQVLQLTPATENFKLRNEFGSGSDYGIIDMLPDQMYFGLSTDAGQQMLHISKDNGARIIGQTEQIINDSSYTDTITTKGWVESQFAGWEFSDGLLRCTTSTSAKILSYSTDPNNHSYIELNEVFGQEIANIGVIKDAVETKIVILKNEVYIEGMDISQVESGVSTTIPTKEWTEYHTRTAKFLTVSVSAYEPDGSEAGKYVHFTSVDETTITLPKGLADGFQCIIVNKSDSTVTLVADTDVTLESAGNILTDKYASCVVVYEGNDVWSAYGKLD